MLRYYVHHQQCHKRMFGKTRKGYGYYTCQPQLDRVGNPEAYADHPPTVYVREDALLECVQTFFNERVFGPDRAVLLRHQLRDHDSSDRDDIQQQIAAIEKAVAEITRRQNNLLDERESRSFSSGDETADAWAGRLRHRFAELEHERRTKNTALEALREQAARRPPNEPDLIEDLPRLALQLTNAPDALQRDLYEAFGLKIVYDHNAKRATIHATLTTETLPAAAQATAALTALAPPEPAVEPPPASNQTSTRPVTGRATTEKVAHVGGALGRIRTCGEH